LAGFIASQFAYGRVDQVKQFLGELFGRMENGPYRFISSGNFGSLRNLYYRFQKGDEIIHLFGVLRTVVRRYGGIGPMLEHFFDGDLRRTLWTARRELIGNVEDLIFFFPKSGSSSPLKRWNLYARWMVRQDDIDFGLWGFMKRSDLVIPLDANVYKISRCHGWTNQKAQSWKAACDITSILKFYCPEDPLKYDFLMCHVIGIEGGCTGVKNERCAERCFVDEI
jgi:uncharacterized protein (TIGR02757 family)